MCMLLGFPVTVTVDLVGRREVGKEEGKRFGFYKVKEIYFLRS